jgi:hypothetical protein
VIVEIHDAIVSAICLSVNNVKDRKKGYWPTAAGATDKTVLFHYNLVGTGLVSLNVVRMQGFLHGVPGRQSYQVVL